MAALLALAGGSRARCRPRGRSASGTYALNATAIGTPTVLLVDSIAGAGIAALVRTSAPAGYDGLVNRVRWTLSAVLPPSATQSSVGFVARIR